MRVKRDYCNDCRQTVDLRYLGHDRHSIFARCTDCGAHFDLIYTPDKLRAFKPCLSLRMAFYLRAVNRYNGARFDILRGRPVKVPPASRPDRLLCYKLALSARLEAERGRPAWS
jgi:hypothetical protein